jgi:hypothetical protein
LRAANRAPKTIATYLAAVGQLDTYLHEMGMRTDVTKLRGEHIEAFIVHLLETRSASTASNRQCALQQSFKWAVDEGEIQSSPMDRMEPTQVEDKMVPVRRVLPFGCCTGPARNRRDQLIGSVLVLGRDEPACVLRIQTPIATGISASTE